MENKKVLDEVAGEALFTGVDDEEVVNCEGGPCSFVVKEG